MIWVFLIVVVIMVPEVVSILMDSRLARAFAARIESGVRQDSAALENRIQWLEGEVERLGQTLEEVRAEGEFVHRLLADAPDEQGRSVRDPNP
jgi:hypothetical protein